MKSPWKYLLDLTSRARATVPLEGATEVVTEQTRPSSGISFAAPIVPADDAKVSTPLASKEPGRARDPEKPSVVEERVGSNRPSTDLAARVSLERELPSDSRPTRRKTRPRKRRPGSVAPAACVEYGLDNSEVPQPSTFSDEIAALDEDIRRLRRELAAKLSLQNTQLKKMLKRF